MKTPQHPRRRLVASKGWDDLQNVPVSTQKLQSGLAALELSLSAHQVAQLLRYLQLLYKWNKVYNLTAVPPEEGVQRHLLDALTVAGTIEELFFKNCGDVTEPHLMDAGTGAGLPGVPLAIVFPQLRVHCVDAVEKKMRFLQQVQSELGLSNLYCHNTRLETWTEPLLDGIICRAFASTQDFLRLCAPLVREKGWLLDMKSEQLECYDIQNAACSLFHVKPLWTPADVRVRNLLIYQKTSSAC